MVETLLENRAQWLSGDGPDADIVVSCECRLSRNLSDFPFPGRCRADERASIEERARAVFDSLNLMSTGTYWSLDELSPLERQLLFERRLIGEGMANGGDHCGVYIADDQSLSVSVNGENHIVIRGLGAGLQLQDVWSRVSVMDDTLTASLDYAFDERLGYLTSAIDEVGTGMRANVEFHTASGWSPQFSSEFLASIKDRRHRVCLSKSAKPGVVSGFVIVENGSTLGLSEDEILFHLKHLATERGESDRKLRARMLSEGPLQMEDRIGRALGLARGARMLTLEEALETLSSLRLGISLNVLDQFSYPLIDEMHIACRDAHLAFKSGAELDSLALNAERADLFRSRFA